MKTFHFLFTSFVKQLSNLEDFTFPCGIGNNCSCIYLSGNSTDFKILLTRFDMFFGVVTSIADIFPCSVLE